MSFIKKGKVPVIVSTDQVPQEWFLEIKDLNKPEIKDYMDEEFRKKSMHSMLTNMVKDIKLKDSKSQTGSG